VASVKLYLVRHGQSTGNVSGTLMGQSDHPLTPLGERQARAAAAWLAPLGPLAVYASDLRRARQTAEQIAAAWSGAVVLDARLREMSLGEYEGRPWQEFEADTELTQALAAAPYETTLPGGESLAVMETRVLAAVREIVAAGEDACLVAHDGSIRALLNHYLGVPPQKWWTLSTVHGGISLLEFGDEFVALRFVNASDHLHGLEPDHYVPASD